PPWTSRTSAPTPPGASCRGSGPRSSPPSCARRSTGRPCAWTSCPTRWPPTSPAPPPASPASTRSDRAGAPRRAPSPRPSNRPRRVRRTEHGARTITLSVIGVGYLGAVHAAARAELGHDVIGLDIDAERISALQAGIPPFHEPGFEQILRRGLHSGRLRFTTD